MTNVTFAYSSEEHGWVANEITLTSNIVLLVCFKDRGKVVIKQRNEANGPNPKVYISRNLESLELKVVGETNGKRLQVITSEEPKYIKYANI